MTKINITFFVGIEVLNIFHLTIFSKKTIFSKITAKNNFGGTTSCEEEKGRSDNKSEYNLFTGKKGTEYCF